MKSKLTDFLTFISKIIPANLLSKFVRREVISVFYHAVSDYGMDHVRHLYPVVSVAEFESALDYMQTNFNFITYQQLHDHRLNGAALPPNSIHLSFDDGFAECFSVVRPILLERQIPCTFFLTLDWIDNRMLYFRHLISLCVQKVIGLNVDQQKEFFYSLNASLDLKLSSLSEFKSWLTAFRSPDDRILGPICNHLKINLSQFLRECQPYLTTAQIREMHAEGFTIGAHGLSHRKLGFIPENEIQLEIVQSCSTIQAITSQQIVPFSFPQSAGNVKRAQLAKIRERNPFIGLLFDTKDLRQDENIIVNRVWAERPLTAERILHPWPEIIANAYRDAWVDDILRVGRGLF
jgi:peptidoglycan/xylan/chitin deacetylase (PgdA/CDA1 family)